MFSRVLAVLRAGALIASGCSGSDDADPATDTSDGTEATGTGLDDIALSPGQGDSIFATGTTTAPEWSLTVG